MDELNQVINNCKSKKAPSIDRIPFEFYKKFPDIGLQTLLDCFNNIFITGEVPKSFKKAVIFPLHKKGDKAVVSNYQGISFLNCIGKVFTGLLLLRLEHWIEVNNLLNEFQAGFRRGYSTIDNIFNIYNIVNLKLPYKRNKVYAFFVDFSSAFDRISREALWYKLDELGLSTRMKTVLRNSYIGTESAVWNREGYLNFFTTERGVAQGSVTIPTLFALYLHDLHEALDEGIWIEQLNIRVLLYADDIVILALHPKQLQTMIYNLEKYTDKWDLEVNLNK